jgi:hypothetical protein
MIKSRRMKWAEHGARIGRKEMHVGLGVSARKKEITEEK